MMPTLRALLITLLLAPAAAAQPPAPAADAPNFPPAPRAIELTLDETGIRPPAGGESYFWDGETDVRVRVRNTASVTVTVALDLQMPAALESVNPADQAWNLEVRWLAVRAALDGLTCQPAAQPGTGRCVANLTVASQASEEFRAEPFMEPRERGYADMRFLALPYGQAPPFTNRTGRLFIAWAPASRRDLPQPPRPQPEVTRGEPEPSKQTSRAQVRQLPATAVDPAAVVQPPPPAWGELAPSLYVPCPIPEKATSEIELPLDNTGWSDGAYHNRRNPPNILPTVDPQDDVLIATLEAQQGAYLKCLQEKKLALDTVTAPDLLPAANRLRASLKIEQDAFESLKPPASHQFLAARALELKFLNATADRTLSIAFTIPHPIELDNERFPEEAVLRQPRHAAALAAFEASRHVRIDTCRTKDNVCDVIVTVPPLSFASVRASIFFPVRVAATRNSERVPPIELVATFFNVDLKPAFGSAFISTVDVDQLAESPSKTSWSVTASITGQLGPNLPPGVSFSASSPYQEGLLRSYAGSGVLTLAQTLGNRASADVNLAYQAGVYGGDPATEKVTATSYKATINSFAGTTLTFGRFLVAAPSNGLGGRDEGDALRYTFKKFSASALFRRESSLFKPDPSNRDDKALILEVSNLASGSSGMLRAINLYASVGRNRDVLAGEEAKKITELRALKTDAAGAEADALAARERLRRQYWTLGGEVVLSPNPEAYAAISVYHHGYQDKGLVLADRPFRKGNGWDALLTTSHTFFGPPEPITLKRAVRSTLNFQLGAGTGDDPDSPTTDDSFMGQSGAFAPDALYLSKFAPKLLVSANGVETTLPTLSTKWYAGVGYTARGFSIAEVLMRALRVPPRDIDYRATILWVRYYGFTTEVFEEHDAGFEIFANSQVTAPKGVETSIQLGKFWPLRALDPVFESAPWTASINVTVKLVN